MSHYINVSILYKKKIKTSGRKSHSHGRRNFAEKSGDFPAIWASTSQSLPSLPSLPSLLSHLPDLWVLSYSSSRSYGNNGSDESDGRDGSD